MKHFKIIYLMFFAGLLLGSCEDFLDTKPQGKLIPSTVAELEKLLNNSVFRQYNFYDNNMGNYYALLGDNVQMSALMCQYQYPETHYNLARLAAYIYNPPYLKFLQPDAYHWSYPHSAIYYANTVINGINNLDASEKNSDYAKEVIAQAKAARAWSYIMLTLQFGPAYNPNGANDTRVIAHRTTGSVLDANPDLSTTAELFDLIEADLDDALDAPTSSSHPLRANKAAVHALRAMLFMHKADYASMFTEADLAWNATLANATSVDDLIYDYNQFSYTGTPSSVAGEDPEVSMTLEGQDDYINTNYHRENLFYRGAAMRCTYENYPSDEYVALFAANDLRKKLFLLKKKGYSTTVDGVVVSDPIMIWNMRTQKFSTSYYPNAGITHPILLLMRAEANARNNQLSNALADLNTLRKYRYDKNDGSTDLPNGSSMTQEQLLYEILNERRREQNVNTNDRVFDLKRFLVQDPGKPWTKTTIDHVAVSMETPSLSNLTTKTYSAPINNEYFNARIDNSTITDYNPHWGLTPYNGPDWNPRSGL